MFWTYRVRVFFLALAALTVLLGIEIHRSDRLPTSHPAAPPRSRADAFSRDGLTPQNPARCPEGAVYSGVIAPVKVIDVQPVYPAAARDAGVSGVVIVQALIDKNGAIAAAKVVRSVPPLDAAALDAVKGWRFTPTTLDGNLVCVGVTVTVDVHP